MKFVLLAATALAAAVPAFAQDAMTPAPTQGQTTMPADPAAPMTPDEGAPAPQDPAAMPADTATMPADPAAPPAQTTDTPPPPPAPDGGMAPAPTGTAPGTAMADPAGGYQPTGPALQGQSAPGATVRFQAAQTPEQAYPAPAPLAKYPVCKKGQYDKCIQRGGK